MYTVFHVNANELDDEFLASLKNLFRDKEIEIVISEVDETAYLLKTEANRERLLNAIVNIETKQNLVEVPADML
jgi:antitoxin YefM